ncbi:NYN domain-containing protein [Candidatus Pacearchaeota archaeon]|nr:NYN domain-containing protein [Candidatus Pacearchaeota archaeon]
MEKKKECVVIFIDGSNFYHSSKKLNVVEKINFQKLISELVGDRELVKVFYYNAPLDISVNPKIYWKQQKFFNVLREIPKVEVILCKQRKVKRDGEIEYEVKGDDTHLVSDLVGEAYENLYDTAIIVSGDEDFISPIKRVRKLGKKIENAWFSSSSSFNLRNACNRSIHLNKILSRIID